MAPGRLLAEAAVGLLAAVAQARGDDGAAPLFRGASAPSTTASVRPVLGRGLTPVARFAVQEAFPLAASLVSERPACRELFAELGADGVERLRFMVFVMASADQEQRVCRGRGAFAITARATPVIRLCKTFGRLGKMRAALALIHEALHFAGVPENPPDPGAMTATQIQRMVEQSCTP